MNKIEQTFHPGITPYVYKGEISPLSETSSVYSIQLLRDTGASTSLLKFDIIPNLKCSEDKILTKGLFGNIVSVSVIYVYVKCALGFYEVPVGVIEALPEGVTFVLANDLVHQIPSPVVPQKPIDHEFENTDILPQCVVTRSMTKQDEDNE